MELDNVVKFYGPHQALGPLTLTVPEGSIGLLGPNGSGKTTLLRLVLGLLRPTSGVVRVLGEEVSPSNKSVRRRIGYAPEGEAMFPELTGVEAVAYAGRLVGMRKPDAISRAHQVLDYVELGEARYRLVEKYSTGMRQRLKLAQALVHDPDVLILDEPTEGVDPQAHGHLLDLIQELHKEHGLQLIISTHLLHDVERLTSHALVLKEGRVAAQGSLEELRKNPSRAFLVRVSGDTTFFTNKLTKAGIPWEPMAPNIRVDSGDPQRILEVVAEAGLTVRHMAPLELTLVEAFEQAVAGAMPPPNAPMGGGAPA